MLDYVLLDKKLTPKLTSAKITDGIGTGADHRTVVATIKTQIEGHSKAKRKLKSAGGNKGWVPKDAEEFQSQLKSKLREVKTRRAETWSTMDADTKCRDIEEILVELAATHKGTEKEERSQDNRMAIRKLIGDRKREREAGNSEAVKDISKQLRKMIRARDKCDKTAKIEKILAELKGLKSIAGIGANGKTNLIGSLVADGATGDCQCLCRLLRKSLFVVTTDYRNGAGTPGLHRHDLS